VGQPSPPSSTGWYPDPAARFEFRYFNGESWTADVSAAGRRFVDPLGPPGTRRDGRATAAMVLGIAGVTTGWMPFVFVVGVVCSVLGIIFGTIVLRQRGEPRSFALAGVLTGVGGLLLVVLGVVTTRVVTRTINEFIDEPPAVVELDRCVVNDGAATVEGSIENRGDRSSDYRIVVAVGELPSRDQIVIEVDDVEPGAPARFGATAAVDLRGEQPEAACDVVDITGPLPFGLDI
jgi:Protein of unknown function (DUF2510)